MVAVKAHIVRVVLSVSMLAFRDLFKILSLPTLLDLFLDYGWSVREIGYDLIQDALSVGNIIVKKLLFQHRRGLVNRTGSGGRLVWQLECGYWCVFSLMLLGSNRTNLNFEGRIY